MKKLGRFTLLLIAYVSLFVLSYSVIPLVCTIFGGSFLGVAQHPFYVTMANLFLHIMLATIFGECFDSDFNSKISSKF